MLYRHPPFFFLGHILNRVRGGLPAGSGAGKTRGGLENTAVALRTGGIVRSDFCEATEWCVVLVSRTISVYHGHLLESRLSAEIQS
jgi:hypothetical protein